MTTHESATDSRKVGGAEINKNHNLLIPRNAPEIKGFFKEAIARIDPAIIAAFGGSAIARIARLVEGATR